MMIREYAHDWNGVERAELRIEREGQTELRPPPTLDEIVDGLTATANFVATAAEFWADADKGDVFEELDDFMSQSGGRVNWLASMAQDVEKGRHSEIDFMNGLICQKGREVNIATPYNDAIVEAMRLIDNGAIQRDPTHVDRIVRAVEA